jgi:peptidyl-tRNA hydrolase, PTH1 family
MENAHLIVGLGNPGAEYAVTRHNAGFLLADRLARRWHGRWLFAKKFNARLVHAERDGKKMILAQPQTYMNLSGEAVAGIMAYYRVLIDGVLILVDDADLPLGEIRLRAAGSSGGHHGLESIEQHLGTQNYARLRLGIGRQPSVERQIKDYVLSRFTAEETSLFENALKRAEDQVECWNQSGIGKAMTEFNGLGKDRKIKELE